MPVLPFVVEGYGAPKWVYGILLTFYAAFQFIGAPYLGAMSDRKGRKPILLISQAGTLLAWFVFLGAIHLPNIELLGIALPLLIIGLSRVLDGVTGGNSSVTNAYLADITTREEKSYIFGYMGGIVGIGLIIGPAIGGLTASSSLGYKGTLLASIFISVVALASIFWWLKESHPKEKRSKEKAQSIFKSMLILQRIKKLKPERIIKLLFSLKFMYSIMSSFYISTIALFIIDVFKFDELQLGYFMFVVGLFLAINQAFISKIFIKRFGEFNTLMIGFALTVLGLIGMTLTQNLYLYFAIYYVLNLGVSLCFPTFNSLIAIHANEEKQGETLGINEALYSLCMAAFPVLATYLYSMIGSDLYLFMSLIPLISLIVGVRALSRLCGDKPCIEASN